MGAGFTKAVRGEAAKMVPVYPTPVPGDLWHGRDAEGGGTRPDSAPPNDSRLLPFSVSTLSLRLEARGKFKPATSPGGNHLVSPGKNAC